MGLTIGLSSAVHLILGLLVAALPVRVTTTSGDQLEGEWSGIETGAIALEQGGDTIRIPVESLADLAPLQQEERTGPAMRVYLQGGTQIAAQEVSLADETLSVEPRRQASVAIPVERVSAIRFRSPSPATDPQWLGLMEQDQRGDLLVVRREEGQLDPVPGVISGISDGEVTFSLGDDSVNAPIERLEGLRFGGTADPGGKTVATVSDVYGSTWAVAELLPSAVDDTVTIRLPGDVRHSVPVDQIASIRWSSGLTLLARQEPAEQQYRPYLETKVPSVLLEGWFGPRMSGDDVILTAGSSVAFRIEPGFETLSGSVRRDASVAEAGQAAVRILLDGEVAWEQRLKDATSLGFELPIAEAGRVQFEILPGDDGDVGDTVRVQRPRLLK